MDDGIIGLLILIALGIFFSPLILAIVALSRTGDLRRRLVWLGAVALVLAGIFLIKYSIDNALLTPAMRATFGLALGVVLTLAGEWLRRRPLQRELASLKPDYVPGALTSAGLFICFAS